MLSFIIISIVSYEGTLTRRELVISIVARKFELLENILLIVSEKFIVMTNSETYKIRIRLRVIYSYYVMPLCNYHNIKTKTNSFRIIRGQGILGFEKTILDEKLIDMLQRL